MESPTGRELAHSPQVVPALVEALRDSLPADRENRHEEGGWIYQHRTNAEIITRRASPGQQAAIDLSQPPIIEGFLVVAKFHTHPNPSSEGWEPGPSRGDQEIDEIHGVPDIIISDRGFYYSGPERRRGGLNGPPGYPE